MNCILGTDGRGRGGLQNVRGRGSWNGSIITVRYSAVLVSYTVPINCNITNALCQIIFSLALRMTWILFWEPALFPWGKSYLGLRRIVTESSGNVTKLSYFLRKCVLRRCSIVRYKYCAGVWPFSDLRKLEAIRELWN